MLIPETVAQGVFTEYTADLSAYAGQVGYIAIRHFNVTNMYHLGVDNITITDDWVEADGVTSPYTLDGLDDHSIYEVEVQAVTGEQQSSWSTLRFNTPRNATILYRQDFDDTNDINELGWTFVDNDGDGRNWTMSINGKFDDAEVSPSETSTSVPNSLYSQSFTDDGEVAFNADNWAITPAIEIYESSILSFQLAYADPDYHDKVGVYVGETANVNEMTEVLAPKIFSRTYELQFNEETVDLSAFAAQTLNVTIATDKTALNNAITEAEAYYSTISESNPDAAAVLQTAINTAKGVQDNADATQSEVETAAQTLNDALNAAKADVALKRITLVIPAKSYMARIDADKRQIENVVDGVSLYSVNSVTNTEVVLTGELTVIAAEMPFFIYNDNDTEVEVSIVVSSEDADNVDYDSEHFKGTLVDKTFTNEDMEEADHYVLNGGSSFVWVKDAGVLAAGKCWIQLPKSPANARALSIVFEGETTGISEELRVKSEKFATAPVYDLQGRRVMQPTRGLFIVGGKKVVVK